MLSRLLIAPQVCERHIQEISHLESMVQIPSDWKIEQAKMFWCRGEKNRAMHLLKSLLRNCEKVCLNFTELYFCDNDDDTMSTKNLLDLWSLTNET